VNVVSRVNEDPNGVESHETFEFEIASVRDEEWGGFILIGKRESPQVASLFNYEV
jgi:hypothetical protein